MAKPSDQKTDLLTHSKALLLGFRKSQRSLGEQLGHLGIDLVGLLLSEIVRGCSRCELGPRGFRKRRRAGVELEQVLVGQLDAILEGGHLDYTLVHPDNLDIDLLDSGTLLLIEFIDE